MLGGNLGSLLYGDVSVMGFSIDYNMNFQIRGLLKVPYEHSSVFISFQVVSLFFFVSEPSGSLQ